MKHTIEVAATLLPELTGILINKACQLCRFRFSFYASEDDLLSAIGISPPDIVVMGLDADGSRPLALQRNLWNAREPACVIFVAANPNVGAVVTAMQLGAAFMSAESGVHACYDTLQEASQLHAARSQWMRETRDAQQRIEQLSPRQNEVMTMVLAGLTNKAIALLLKVSEKTIEKHRDLIRQRTETSTAADLERINAVAARPVTAVYRLSLHEIQEFVPQGIPERKVDHNRRFRVTET